MVVEVATDRAMPTMPSVSVCACSAGLRRRTVRRAAGGRRLQCETNASHVLSWQQVNLRPRHRSKADRPKIEVPWGDAVQGACAVGARLVQGARSPFLIACL